MDKDTKIRECLISMIQIGDIMKRYRALMPYQSNRLVDKMIVSDIDSNMVYLKSSSVGGTNMYFAISQIKYNSSNGELYVTHW